MNTKNESTKKIVYTFLIALEIVLLIISEILDTILHISNIELVNNIGLVVLALPIWLLLFNLRKENLKPFLKFLAKFFFIVFSIALPISLVLMLID